jgi:hypothetical protein
LVSLRADSIVELYGQNRYPAAVLNVAQAREILRKAFNP